jgi:hypothetical protein
MQIKEIFATTIQQRIEPVVKVADRRPSVVLGELGNLVVTPQWERYLHQVLDAYADAADREDEQGIGVWISGFFGSGKSLLMKTLGVLLQGGQIDGQEVADVFMNRVPASSPYRQDLQRFLAACSRRISTTAVGGNLHALLSGQNDPLALIVFKLFAQARDYTANWPLAWAVEYQIDARGKSADFRDRATVACGVEWDEIQADPEYYLEYLYGAAAETLPDHFSDGAVAVERSVNAVTQAGIDPQKLVDRLRRWCQAQDAGGRRHKLLLQLDELGQWIAAGGGASGLGNATDRTMQVQALAETAATSGGGRIWLAVTAHGDIQALRQNVQQEYYAKIVQRFALPCKLSNDDISEVVEKRLLQKTQTGRAVLEDRFNQRAGELADLGTLRGASRVYPVPVADSFARFYPYLPWTVTVIPDVVKGIAQATGRDEALSGANRTMIGVVQGAIIESNGLLNSPMGRLLALADLYYQLSSDVAIETKTDLNRIPESVPEATPFTGRVAKALFLLGQSGQIPTTLENVTRALVDSLDANLATLSRQARLELDRLVNARYAKQVGDQWVFLSTQQRGFQDKVRNKQDELLGQAYELSQALKDYEAEEMFRFDRVPLAAGPAGEREMQLKLELDGRIVRNPQGMVPLHVYSPIQRSLDPAIADDNALRQRSSQEPDGIILRMGEAQGLRATLALAVATQKVADETISSVTSAETEKEIARQAKQVDLPGHKTEVRRLLAQSVRNGQVFFRGTVYQLAGGDSAASSVRTTLAQVLPQIYTRFYEVPYRITNEQTAVRAALAGNTNHADLQALGVYRADGMLNEGHSLLSALRGRLPLVEQDRAPVEADALRAEFERPPFGWDGNCVKVGLALLLRAAGCRLIEGGQVLTDPALPAVFELLAKEQRFRGLRVQGVRSEITISELQTIRSYIEAIFGGARPPLVAATLNNLLGEQLAGMGRRAVEVESWANTAQCPLPLEFQAGTARVNELLNNPAQNVRLPAFAAQGDRLIGYSTLLDGLAAFRQEQGAAFTRLRDFYQGMVNANVDLPEVRRFVEDWRTLVRDRNVTDPARWNEIVPVHQAAVAAVTAEVNRLYEQARTRLTQFDAQLEANVRATGVPEEHLGEEMEAVRQLYAPVRARLARPPQNLGEARALLSELTAAELALRPKLVELRSRYQVATEPESVHLRWQDLGGTARIANLEELDQVMGQIRLRIAAELERNKIVHLG